jgi:hypothetical protein
MKYITALSLYSLACLLAIVSLGCGSPPPGQKAENSTVTNTIVETGQPVSELCLNTDNASRAVKSFRYSIRITQLDTTNGRIINTDSEGAGIIPDLYSDNTTRDTEIEGGGFKKTSETVIAFGKEYTRLDDGDWIVSELPPNNFFLAPGASGYLKLSKIVHQLPDGDIKGTTCLHFQGTCNLYQVSSVSDTSSDNSTVLDIWIGKDDLLLRQAEFNSNISRESEQYKRETLITLRQVRNIYDYNSQIVIEPPAIKPQ